jgi:hypothetical protein
VSGKAGDGHDQPPPPPPPLTDAEQEALDDTIDTQIWNHHAEQTYDQWRNLGLVS